MSWITSLGAYATAKKNQRDTTCSNPTVIDEQQHLRHLVEALSSERSVARTEPHPSYAVIPRFYVKKTAAKSAIEAKVEDDARKLLLKRKVDELLDDEDLDKLWSFLCPPGSKNVEEERVSYVQYQMIGAKLPPKVQRFFKPSVFFKLVPDKDGRVKIMQIYNYVIRKVSLLQARISFSAYDVESKGTLSEGSLEKYIADVLPTFPQIGELDANFAKFYLCAATRRFFFFLDPQRVGRLSIKDVLLSPILTEFFELREPELSPELEQSNWFSLRTSQRIYDQYVELDTDQNGMLSRSEMSYYSGGSLTDAFLDRLFEESQTYAGEMDYKSYLDFVQALENIQTPQAIQYFFRILDWNKQKHLSESAISYYFNAVSKRSASFGQEYFRTLDVVNELFDMVRPSNPERITVEDLIKCGCGGTVINILIDVNGFYSYDAQAAGQ